MAQPAPAATQAKPPARSKIIRYITIIALTSSVALGIEVLIKWVVIKPSELVYVFEDGSTTHGFDITDGAILDYNLKGNTLNATFRLIVEVVNPTRRASVDYDSVEVQVWFQDQMIANEVCFTHQRLTYNITGLSVTDVQCVANGSGPLEEHVLQEFKHQRSLGHVDLEVHLQSRIRFTLGLWKSKYYNLSLLCSPVKLFFSPPYNSQTICCRENRH